MKLKKMIAAALVAAMPLALAACADEDNDGVTTDEELEQMEDGVDEGADHVEDGADELEDELTGTTEAN